MDLHLSPLMAERLRAFLAAHDVAHDDALYGAVYIPLTENPNRLICFSLQGEQFPHCFRARVKNTWIKLVDRMERQFDQYSAILVDGDAAFGVEPFSGVSNG